MQNERMTKYPNAKRVSLRKTQNLIIGRTIIIVQGVYFKAKQTENTRTHARTQIPREKKIPSAESKPRQN